MCIGRPCEVGATEDVRTVFVFASDHPLSRVCLTLVIDDHPPHNMSHDIGLYPLFYDPLYYPRFYPYIFCASGSFCSWLQSSLFSHHESCTRCRGGHGHVTVTFNDNRLSVDVCGMSMSFSTAYFEAADYSLGFLHVAKHSACLNRMGTLYGSVTTKLTVPQS